MGELQGFLRAGDARHDLVNACVLKGYGGSVSRRFGTPVALFHPGSSVEPEEWSETMANMSEPKAHMDNLGQAIGKGRRPRVLPLAGSRGRRNP